jgi:iron(III) transport system permease protein
LSAVQDIRTAAEPGVENGVGGSDPDRLPTPPARRRIDVGNIIPFVAVAVLIVLVAMPLYRLIEGSLQTQTPAGAKQWTLGNYEEAYTSPFTYPTLKNSFIFAIGSSTLAFVIAFTLAWLVERTNVPFARAFILIAVVPLIVPGILETISWTFLFSPRTGMINVAIRDIFGIEEFFNIFSLPGMIWVQAVGGVPLAFLLLSAGFKSMDPALEEAAMASGANNRKIAARVTFPLLLPASASALLVLMVRGLEAFEVPAILGTPANIFTYTNEIFRANSEIPPNRGLAAALSVGLLAISAVGVWLLLRLTRHGERFRTVTGKAFRPRRLDLGRWRWLGFATLLAYGVFAVVLPVLSLVWASLLRFFQQPSREAFNLVSLESYRVVLEHDSFQSALRNSLLLAIAAPTLVMLLASIIGWVVHKSRKRGATALEFLAFLPITIPGLVLGVAFILMWASSPIAIYGTLWLVVFAYVTKFMPYGLRFVSGSMLQIHNELEEAASASGASWWATFRRITLPLLRPGLAAGWIYACIISFREFSSSVLLVGPGTNVLSVQLFNFWTAGYVTEVAAMGVLMVLALLLIVGVFYKLTGNVGVQQV